MKEELARFVDKEFIMMPTKNLNFKVKVKALDVKKAFNNTLVLVSPLSGEGSMWVYESGLMPIK